MACTVGCHFKWKDDTADTSHQGTNKLTTSSIKCFRKVKGLRPITMRKFPPDPYQDPLIQQITVYLASGNCPYRWCSTAKICGIKVCKVSSQSGLPACFLPVWNNRLRIEAFEKTNHQLFWSDFRPILHSTFLAKKPMWLLDSGAEVSGNVGPAPGRMAEVKMALNEGDSPMGTAHCFGSCSVGTTVLVNVLLGQGRGALCWK